MRVSTALSLAGLAAALTQTTRPRQAGAPVLSIDGQDQYFAGTNTWWMSHLTSDEDVEKAMSQIADSGLKVTRFLDTANQAITINNEANGIARLDAAVAAAERHNLQLVLPMLNNWDDLGGINTYCDYFGCTHETFWTHAEVQQAYKDYVTFIANRIKTLQPSSPGSYATNPDVRTVTPVCSLFGPARYLASSNRWILTIISTLDYGTVHMYPIGWGYIYPWGNQWISDHAALGRQYGKPIVMEEYGVESTTSNRTAVLQEWQQTILDSNIAYDSFWQFGMDFPSGANPYDAYAIFYGTQEYQDVVVEHAQAINTKPV